MTYVSLEVYFERRTSDLFLCFLHKYHGFLCFDSCLNGFIILGVLGFLGCIYKGQYLWRKKSG